MIVYPINWARIGRHIGIKEIDSTLNSIIWGINCNALSFSGGLDSSLLLYHMCMVRAPVTQKLPIPVSVFTAVRSKTHPDIIFAKKVAKYFRKKFPYIQLTHHIFYVPDGQDNGIKLFYEFIAKHTNEIIAGDGIDEFMAGYYDHQSNHVLLEKERIYYYHIRALQRNHLIPLHEASGKVKVYLPYIDESLIALYSQIPLSGKVDNNTRKKVMVAMAKGKVPDEVLLRRKYGFCDVS